MTTPAPTHSSLPRAALIDAQTLMSIRNLELRARVVVEGFWSGAADPRARVGSVAGG